MLSRMNLASAKFLPRFQKLPIRRPLQNDKVYSDQAAAMTSFSETRRQHPASTAEDGEQPLVCF